MKLRHLLLILVAMATFNSFAQGTNLRGQVINYYYQQQMPMVSAKVDLYVFDSRRAPGNQWILLGSTITDAYGFYFFRGVPIGQYTVWVNQAKSYNINVFQIDYRYYTYQDLPQFIY